MPLRDSLCCDYTAKQAGAAENQRIHRLIAPDRIVAGEHVPYHLSTDR